MPVILTRTKSQGPGLIIVQGQGLESVSRTSTLKSDEQCNTNRSTVSQM